MLAHLCADHQARSCPAVQTGTGSPSQFEGEPFLSQKQPPSTGRVLRSSLSNASAKKIGRVDVSFASSLALNGAPDSVTITASDVTRRRVKFRGRTSIANNAVVQEMLSRKHCIDVDILESSRAPGLRASKRLRVMAPKIRRTGRADRGQGGNSTRAILCDAGVPAGQGMKTRAARRRGDGTTATPRGDAHAGPALKETRGVGRRCSRPTLARNGSQRKSTAQATCDAPEGCETQPSFGDAYERKARFCTRHRELCRHVAVRGMYCQHLEGCGQRALYNADGVLLCAKHLPAPDTHLGSTPRRMQNDLCSAPRCQRLGIYGSQHGQEQGQGRPQQQDEAPGGRVVPRERFCSRHKRPADVNLRNARCKGAGCTKSPSFGDPASISRKALYCKAHSPPGWVDMRNRKCDRCYRRALWGWSLADTDAAAAPEAAGGGMANFSSLPRNPLDAAAGRPKTSPCRRVQVARVSVVRLCAWHHSTAGYRCRQARRGGRRCVPVATKQQCTNAGSRAPPAHRPLPAPARALSLTN